MIWGPPLLLALVGAAAAAPPGTAAPLQDVAAAVPGVRLDIRYATADNIAGRALYDVPVCLLRAPVVAMVRRAQAHLAAQRPPLGLLLKDCYRPHSVQRRLFDAVKGGRGRGYVADPNGPTGSVHSYGAAVDVTLCDAAGHELDLGTPYDFLGRRAEPRREAEMRRTGALSAAALGRRELLRAAMVGAGGFRAIRNEWWHFDALQGAALRAAYGRLDEPLRHPAAAP